MLLVAFALRTVALDRFPPGLYHDEAYYGLDAVGVLQGDLQVYFAANNGREPLFIYLVSVAIAILGPTALAVRLTAAFVGTLAVAATYALGAQLFSRRVGLAASAWMAVTLWPVWLSRTGFRAGTLACVLALAAAATAHAARRWRGDSPPDQTARRWLIFAGFLAGLTLYTYTAARILPVLGVGLAAILYYRRRLRRSLTVPWLAAAAVTLLPLAIHFARVPADILGRAEQVAVGVGAAGAGTATLAGWAGAIWQNLQAVAGMVLIRGDAIPRHNADGLPVFRWLSAPALVAGVVVLLAGVRGRRPDAHFLVILWLLVMSLPTILAEDAPHYLRAVGLLPALMLLPALSLEVASRSRQRIVRALPAIVVTVGIAGELFASTSTLAVRVAAQDDLGGWRAPEPGVEGYAFEDAAARLAVEIRRLVEAGVPVWLDRRLRDGWASVPYLAPMDRVTLADPYDPVLKSVPGAAFLMPEGLDLDRVWSELPAGVQLELTPGPLARGDLDAEARTMYVRVEGRPVERVTRPIGRFAEGLLLISAEVMPSANVDELGGRHALTLTWEATAPLTDDLTVFVQAIDSTGGILAAVDEPLGGALFGTSRWPTGLQLREVRTVTVLPRLSASKVKAPACFLVGLYHWPAMRRLSVVGEDGLSRRDHVVIRSGPTILNGSACR